MRVTTHLVGRMTDSYNLAWDSILHRRSLASHFFSFPLFICQLLAFFTFVNESQQLDRNSCWLLAWIDNHKQPQNPAILGWSECFFSRKKHFLPSIRFWRPHNVAKKWRPRKSPVLFIQPVQITINQPSSLCTSVQELYYYHRGQGQ